MKRDARNPYYHWLHVEPLEQRRLLSASLEIGVAGEHRGYFFPEQEVRPNAVEHATARFQNYYPPRWSVPGADGYLTEPSRRDPVDLAIDFLQQPALPTGLSPDDLRGAVVTDQYTSQHTGVTHVYLRQTLDGLEIAEANVNANVTSSGELISLSSSFLAGLDDGRQAVHDRLELEAAEGLERLARVMGWPLASEPVAVEYIPYDVARGMTLRAEALSPLDIPAELHYVPVPDGIELAWRFEVRTTDGLHWYNASVSAETGRLLRLVDWVDQARYRVFPLPLESPADGDRSIVVDPHDPVASPFGWHDTNVVTGGR